MQTSKKHYYLFTHPMNSNDGDIPSLEHVLINEAFVSLSNQKQLNPMN